jgi:hypothetical protein
MSKTTIGEGDRVRLEKKFNGIPPGAIGQVVRTTLQGNSANVSFQGVVGVAINVPLSSLRTLKVLTKD